MGMLGYGSVPPIVVTMLRDPVLWVMSAIEHDKGKQRNNGIDSVVANGCHKAIRDKSCVGYRYATFLVECLSTRYDTGSHASNVQEAKLNLDASVFGLVEFFQASLCLLEFQFGWNLKDKTARCRTVVPEASSPKLLRQRRELALLAPKKVSTGWMWPWSSHQEIDGVHVGARDYGASKASMDSVVAVSTMAEQTMGELYAHARELFHQRIAVAEAAIGYQLIPKVADGHIMRR